MGVVEQELVICAAGGKEGFGFIIYSNWSFFKLSHVCSEGRVSLKGAGTLRHSVVMTKANEFSAAVSTRVPLQVM